VHSPHRHARRCWLPPLPDRCATPFRRLGWPASWHSLVCAPPTNPPLLKTFFTHICDVCGVWCVVRHVFAACWGGGGFEQPRTSTTTLRRWPRRCSPACPCSPSTAKSIQHPSPHSTCPMWRRHLEMTSHPATMLLLRPTGRCARRRCRGCGCSWRSSRSTPSRWSAVPVRTQPVATTRPPPSCRGPPAGRASWAGHSAPSPKRCSPPPPTTRQLLIGGGGVAPRCAHFYKILAIVVVGCNGPSHRRVLGRGGGGGGRLVGACPSRSTGTAALRDTTEERSARAALHCRPRPLPPLPAAAAGRRWLPPGHPPRSFQPHLPAGGATPRMTTSSTMEPTTGAPPRPARLAPPWPPRSPRLLLAAAVA
jgi:hypothetical protein